MMCVGGFCFLLKRFVYDTAWNSDRQLALSVGLPRGTPTALSVSLSLWDYREELRQLSLSLSLWDYRKELRPSSLSGVTERKSDVSPFRGIPSWLDHQSVNDLERGL